MTPEILANCTGSTLADAQTSTLSSDLTLLRFRMENVEIDMRTLKMVPAHPKGAK